MKNGDRAKFRSIQKKMKTKISDSKRAYKGQDEKLFRTHDVKGAWKGLKT